MAISEISMRNVVTIDHEATVAQAAARMRRYDIGELVVVERANRAHMPVGLVSDRDITLEVTGQDLDPHHETVGSIMRRGLLTVRDDESLLAALRAMSERGACRAVVIDGAGRPTGLVSIEDILGLMAEVVCMSRLAHRERPDEETRIAGWFDNEAAS